MDQLVHTSPLYEWMCSHSKTLDVCVTHALLLQYVISHHCYNIAISVIMLAIPTS